MTRLLNPLIFEFLLLACRVLLDCGGPPLPQSLLDLLRQRIERKLVQVRIKRSSERCHRRQQSGQVSINGLILGSHIYQLSAVPLLLRLRCQVLPLFFVLVDDALILIEAVDQSRRRQCLYDATLIESIRKLQLINLGVRLLLVEAQCS